VSQAAWTAAAKGWAAATRLGGGALSIADRVPGVLPNALTEVGRAILGDDVVPRYTGDLPRGGGPRIRRSDPEPVAVYFPSCTTTMFGPAGGGSGVAESFVRLAERAGVALVTPDGIPSLCCGTPWKSKGYPRGHRRMSDRVLPALWAASDGGRLPVVCDAASCTEGLATMREHAGGRYRALRLVDATQFVADRMLDALPVAEPVASLVVHPTCSTTAIGADGALTAIARHVAKQVHVPLDAGCCAFAGDRGLLHPELTASATAREAAEVRALGAAEHASANRTCEIGMTRATGAPYRHVLEILERVTR
jgi:D-lactate dehydrogenase